jgi:hypothetical protein
MTETDVHHAEDRIKSMLKVQPPGPGWERIEFSLRMPPGDRSPLAVLYGKRGKDQDETLFRVMLPAKLDLIDKERYQEEIFSRLWNNLMTYTDCDCRRGPIRWHPNHKGEMVVAEFTTIRCPVHEAIE